MAVYLLGAIVKSKEMNVGEGMNVDDNQVICKAWVEVRD
jgi:hypothetical protein